EGEGKTGKELATLLAEGWKVRHHVDLGRGNADHVVRDPNGRAYVLETKALAGSISLEGGRLPCRYVDDPGEVRRDDLTPRMLRLAERVHRMWGERVTGSAPEVSPSSS